jgi:hypothetical protein
VKRRLALLLLALAAAALAPAVQAQRIVLGLHFGVPLYWPAPYYYYPPPYYYMAPYYTPYAPLPPVLSLPPPAVAEREAYYWYYCASAQTYYPYAATVPRRLAARPNHAAGNRAALMTGLCRSMRHQHRHGHRRKERARCAAHYQLARP